jgi:hypothetical protein
MDRVYRAKETRKLVLYGILIFGIIETGVIYLLFPSYYSNNLLYIPAYFMVLGISILLLLSRMKRKRLHPGRAIARLMLFNVAQMLLSFILMFCYWYFMKIENKNVVILSFSVFYVFFMGIKLFIIYNIDNQHKTEKKRLQNADKKI